MAKKYLTAADIGPQVQDVWDQDSGWYKTGPAYEYGFLSEPSNWIPYAKALGYTGPFYNAVPSSNPEAEGGTDSVIAPEFTGFIKKAQAAGYDLAAQADQINKRKVTFGLLTPDGSLQGEQIRGSGSVFEKLAPMALMALGASPLGGMLGSSAASTLGISGLTAAQTAALGSAIGSGGITALRGGDIGDVLKSAAAAGLPQVVNEIVAPFANTIGADVLNATDSKFLSDIVSGAVKGVPGALMSGDASNLLTGAVTGAVGSQVGNELGLTPQQSQLATNIASKLLQGGDLSLSDIVKIGTSFAPGSAMPGTTGNEITEGFFDPGGPGFMPTEYLDDAEVDRELQSLLGRYPAPQPPSDWFLGENIASGIPEWDMAAVNAGLPIGNLEQDFMVNERGQIVDNAGNVGNFVNGEFVVDTGVTPNLSYAATNAPAPAPSAAPGKAPAPKAQSGVDLSGLFAFMGMMNQDEDKPDPYQVAQINTPSPFGTIYDQQQDLLGLMGRG
jgi:hypothetical protein